MRGRPIIPGYAATEVQSYAATEIQSYAAIEGYTRLRSYREVANTVHTRLRNYRPGDSNSRRNYPHYSTNSLSLSGIVRRIMRRKGKRADSRGGGAEMRYTATQTLLVLKSAAHDTLEGARGRPSCEGRGCSSGRQVRRR